MLWLLLLLVLLILWWLGWRLVRLCEAVNPADWGRRSSNIIAGLNFLFCRTLHRLQFSPLPLPESGPVVVVANHMSGLDPLLMIAASPRPLRFIIAREHYEIFGLNWLFRLAQCIPVDRKGRPEQALREALRALEQGDVVALFPHGTIHLDTDPPRKLKGGAVRLAHKVGTPLCAIRLEDVRGAGHTFLSVILPSQARLMAHPLFSCSSLDHEACLSRIQELIETPLQDNRASRNA